MAKPLKKNAKTQYFATISANLLMVGFGCGVGWLSMALPLLQSEKSPLKTGALNVEEISWIGSIISLGALIGNILLGYVVTFIGSRNSILLIGFPQLASWLFMMFGTCPIHLVISRFLTGLVVGGAQVCTSLYTAEIADNEIRGQLGTIYQYSRNFGILFAYTLGSYFDYIVSSIFFSGITILFIVTFMLVPSTPQYLLQKNKQKAAEKAFKFYNKHQLDTKDKDSSNQFEGMKLVAKGVEEDPRIALKDINEARYAIIQATIFALLTSLSGQFIFLTYGSSTIENAGTNLSPELSSICMALFQIMATFVAFILIDRKGRKMLLVLSMLGCALGHAILIGYLFLHSYGIDTSMFHWTPIICMSSVVFSASIGITPLTLICMVEIFPTKTRSFGLTFGTVVMNIFSFFINKAYPILMQIIDLQGCLIIFCVSCTLGTIFALVFVEETKGKDLNEKVEPMSSRRESFVTM